MKGEALNYKNINSKYWRHPCRTLSPTGRAGSQSQHVSRKNGVAPKSWNELTTPEDYDLPLDKAEYQIRPAKWPWQVYII